MMEFALAGPFDERGRGHSAAAAEQAPRWAREAAAVTARDVHAAVDKRSDPRPHAEPAAERARAARVRAVLGPAALPRATFNSSTVVTSSPEH